MIRASLLFCALVIAACATPGRVQEPAAPSQYRLCTDPQFGSSCMPASLEIPASPVIQVDTNMTAPRVLGLSRLS